ncbi:MAG: glycosyltransferase [Lentisphaerae bacterium]|nr:glycosyltransferase [Lentisphaerota bacterium]
MIRFFNHPVRRDFLLWILLFLYMAGIILLAVKDPELLVFYRNSNHPELSLLAAAVMGFTYLYLLATGIISCFYHPIPQEEDDQKLPACTVIVPAYNEGAHVKNTIQSLLQSNYPANKLEIIAINDGSEDDTWEYIQQGAALAPQQVTAINLSQNCGKKHALYLGTRQARGEVVVTVDSDSLVDADTIRALVTPLADPAVGAVAGSIRVNDPEKSFITSLLDVLLVFGCEFLRAAQSVTGLVLCTPGALSAYRKSALLPVLDEWLNQKFMGKPAIIGEDRALATLILRSNYRIVHQRNARATTCVPSTVSGACKMLLRWTRGDIRENLVMTGFAFRSLRSNQVRSWVLLAYWVAFMQNLTLPFLFVPAFVYMLVLGAKDPAIFLGANAIFSLAWASIPAMIYSKYTTFRKAIWALLYGAFCPMLLAFIYIYSFLTLNDSRWLTRKLDRRKIRQYQGRTTL